MSLIVEIQKRFGRFDLDVSFEHEKGVLGLLGHSGCGKSMTLKCIAGIETPDRGRIVLDGRVLFDSERRIDLRPRDRRVGYLFQKYVLFPNMTVEENILAGVKRPKAEQAALVGKLVERFYLQGQEKKLPRMLSGGQQQRVALARMLASEPSIILLDEPFSALDSFLKYQLEAAMMDLFETYEGNVVYVTHDRDEVNHFCDRVCVLEEGKVVGLVSKEELFLRPARLSTAKLSGCKNYSRIRPVGPMKGEARTAHPATSRGSEQGLEQMADPMTDRATEKGPEQPSVFAMDWGAVIQLPALPGPEIDAIGVRSHHVKLRTEPGPNSIPVRPIRSYDNLFEMTVLCRPLTEGCSEGENGIIRVDMHLDEWEPLKDAGELWASFPQDSILLLRA